MAVLALGCGAGTQHQPCGTFGACAAGLFCRHGGPANVGTCELNCAIDSDCPSDQYCETYPPPDGVHDVCMLGARDVASSMAIVELRRGEDDLVLAGEGIEIRRSYALVGLGAADAGLVMTIEAEPADCDHCTRPRYATLVRQPAAEPLVAVGPVARPLPRARVVDTASVEPDREWRREIAIDLEGDGAVDLEGVVRCERYGPARCGEQACDRVCRGTRTSGETDVRAVRCRDLILDVEDCLPSARP